MKPQHSLQRALTQQILTIAAVLMVVSGLVSAAIAFREAKEIQDSLLREISALVKHGHLDYHPATGRAGKEEITEEEIALHIQDMDTPPDQAFLSVPADLREGLQTLTVDGENWRIMVATQAETGQRYLIAQPTELRDDLALASGLNVFLPMLVLVAVMLLLIRWMIHHQFQPLKSLINGLRRQKTFQPESMPTAHLPSEISPFVKAINDLLIRIRQTLDKQQRFIADASHELRTPVTALTLLAENIENAPTEAERRERQQQLKISLRRMKNLLNQLLDLARLQSDQQNLKESVALRDIVQQTIADLYPLAETANIDLGVIQLDSIKVLDQDNRLSQLIHNAIENAIRYTPAGGQVNISLAKQDGKAIFQVEDNGSGIPESALNQVFQPFYRSQEMAQTGNGLGLAISQEIALRLGGKIRLQNQSEGGLRFTYIQPMS